MHILTSLAIAATTPLAFAQTTVGDIAITGFSTSVFGIFAGTAPVVGYATGGFQGSGAASSQAILWDDQNPNDFLIAGFGFVGRATILGPGSVNYALLTNNVGIVSQMSWDAQRQVVFADSGTGQVRRLDPQTGSLTDMSTGTQPWGQDLSASAFDPLTGDVVCGGNGALYRLANGATTATPIVAGLGGFVTGIAFDPVTGELLATVLTVNRVIRVDGSGVVSDVAPPGSVPGPNALDIDHDGDLITGGGTGQVYRVPRAGGSPTFLVNNSSPFGAVNGLAVVGGGGYGRPFGSGCNATFGPATLRASGPFRAGSTVTTTSLGHAPNTLGVLVLGLSNTTWQTAALPLLLDPLLGTVGCSLHVSGDVTFAGVASASSPGSLAFALPLPPAFAGARFYAQHVGLEAVAGGLSWSNGLAFTIR